MSTNLLLKVTKRARLTSPDLLSIVLKWPENAALSSRAKGSCISGATAGLRPTFRPFNPVGKPAKAGVASRQIVCCMEVRTCFFQSSINKLISSIPETCSYFNVRTTPSCSFLTRWSCMRGKGILPFPRTPILQTVRIAEQVQLPHCLP